MKRNKTIQIMICLLVCALIPVCFSACSSGSGSASGNSQEKADLDTSGYLVAIESEPDTVDFQCTTINYIIAITSFNRLVEMQSNGSGDIDVMPSLAESWDISDDGKSYTFHLRDGVTFSNGAALTSSDVLYTLKRLLTHPDACNQEIAEGIVGADKLEKGETDQLEGFRILNDRDFTITLKEPYAAFLACLCMPGASILDEEVTEEAGDRFGKTPESMIGTGSFVLESWKPGEGMLLKANENCWEGPPSCEGLDLRFITEQDDIRQMFEDGRLDILNLDDVGNSAEFFLHGDIYQDRLYEVPRIAITYIALNESMKPLNDVRVRKALQLGLNRKMLLDTIYDGYGQVENGIFPHGLYGYNPDLEEIPYDPEEAKELLAKAGYSDGFDLTVSLKASSTLWEKQLMEEAASMWEKIGVHATVDIISESEFMEKRTAGKLACYTAAWTADYDDPDNFIYTFFGSRGKTNGRSLCYPNEENMERVRVARTIMDPDKRLQEYRDLEKTIIQEDAAWIPLFSRLQHYVTSERLEGFGWDWNGTIDWKYRNMSIRGAD